MKREVTGTLWVLVTLLVIICVGCTMVGIMGLVQYEITDQVNR